ncbi:MAG: response regulator [Spirochaetales bacterium]|nr:response regulator [Spirochaetales bacterium]
MINPDFLDKIKELEKRIIELEKSEEKARNLFENAPVSILEVDFSAIKDVIESEKAKGVKDFKQFFNDHPESIQLCIDKIRIKSINKAAFLLYEAESEEDFQTNFVVTFAQESRSGFIEQVINLNNEENPSGFESVIRTFTGKEVFVSVKLVIPVEYEDTWSHILVSLFDITEQKKAEELLRIQRDISINFSKFVTLKDICFQLLKDMIQIEALDSGGVYLRDQETGELDLIAYLGLGEEFIRSVAHFDADAPQSQFVLDGEPLYKTYVESGFPVDDVRRKEGLKVLAVIPVKHDNVVIAVLNMASHTHAEIPASSRNIIESIGGMIGSYLAHAKAESALKKSEERYHLLLHNIPYVTWISKRNGNTVFMSENVIDYFGFSPEEICKNNTLYWFDRIHPEDLEKVTVMWKQLFINNGFFDIEYRIRRKDNEWIWIHDRAVNTFEKKGVWYAYGLFSDITESKLMEEQLRQSEKMQAIGQLSGGIAHDFNNQLAGILTYAELIGSAVAEDPVLSAYIRNMMSCINHSSNLTSQLLAFSRKGKYQSIDIDIHSIIMEIINILHHSIDKKINIEKKFLARSHFVSGDPSQIQNALLNIALNSRDALPDGGTISFITENVNLDETLENEMCLNQEQSELILITIHDTGIGMSKDIMDHIFEPFFTTKEKGKGTGMGMAAVYGTVKNHNGAIRLDSHPGKGSSVKIYLPSLYKEEKSREMPLKINEKREGEAHILFVDDEQSIRESVEIILTQLGYTITLSENGEKALEYYSKNWDKTDIVILDMIMPVMNGHETFLKMKEINPGIIALLISGYMVSENIQKALTSGIAGFISKPFSRKEFTEKIRELLDR